MSKSLRQINQKVNAGAHNALNAMFVAEVPAVDLAVVDVLLAHQDQAKRSGWESFFAGKFRGHRAVSACWRVLLLGDLIKR
jgi:hypothetical protein